MTGPHGDTQRIRGYCALCVARCGTVATVEDGRFTRLDPDPSHPTGHAICAKGRAAPELVYHPERLTHPLRRTRPKGDPDPGWQRIGWDEALDSIAAAMRRVAERYGPHAVAFTVASGSTTAIGDSSGFIQRLANAFGTPNSKITLDVCGWGRPALASLRRRAAHPEVELHPATAQARGIAGDDWVSIETPEGRVRARARLNADLDPRVVVGEHGWWQGCAELGAPGYDPFGPTSAAFNLLIGTADRDPVSGTPSLRSYLCEIRAVTPDAMPAPPGPPA